MKNILLDYSSFKWWLFSTSSVRYTIIQFIQVQTMDKSNNSRYSLQYKYAQYICTS